jgi:hypothetical protein
MEAQNGMDKPLVSFFLWCFLAIFFSTLCSRQEEEDEDEEEEEPEWKGPMSMMFLGEYDKLTNS